MYLFLFYFQLKGIVDDCECSVDFVDQFNNNRIYPRLASLLSKKYFRFYKVNLKKPCPFWPDDGGCASRACAVESCTEVIYIYSNSYIKIMLFKKIKVFPTAGLSIHSDFATPCLFP